MMKVYGLTTNGRAIRVDKLSNVQAKRLFKGQMLIKSMEVKKR